jgi:glycine/D-amino acid oxidase-like deaminating enzyme/nitrite reductase/ring-hydroxylating ferredoxin subunit
MSHTIFGTSSPLWENQKASSCPSLTANLTADVCIIGAGITGLTTAYRLITQGKNVVILDKAQPGAGETGNTTAHLSNALDDYYFQIEKFHGSQYAMLAAQSHSAAIDYIEKIVAENDIKCDFTRLDGYLFSTEKKILEKELKAAQRAGLSTVSLVDSSTQGGPFKSPALLFPKQGQFHPIKYLNSLSAIINEKGGKLFGLTHVTELKQQEGKIKVITANGFSVTADYVVTATNAPFQGTLSLHAKLIPNRTYAISFLVEKGCIPQALYWDTSEPYHYVRLQPYDDKSDMLVIGGEDHRVGVTPQNDPYTQLENWSRSYFPSLPPPAYRWSGQVLEPVDYLAYIGRHPRFKQVYLATGDSGHGMTHGTIAGLLISDLIQGHSNPWSVLYDPSRFSIRAWKEAIKHNMAACYSYLRYLFLSPQKKALTLQAGEGAIVQCGLRKRAIYKDSLGKVHECSAVCPHLKSLLRWNPIEKTWDCAAHGSRFNTDGSILNGPANKKLACFSVEAKQDQKPD